MESIAYHISSSLTNIFASLCLMSNLVFVGQLVDDDYPVQFSQFGYFVQDQHSGRIIMKGPKVGLLFPIHFLSSPYLSLPLVSCNSDIIDYQVWHKHLEHLNSNALHDMLKSGFLGNKHTPFLNVVHFDCISCKLGKSKILPFPTHHLNVTQPFDTIHNDIWGYHQLYLIHFTWIYFLHLKVEVFSTFKFFYTYVQTQLSSKIINFHSMERNTCHTHLRNSCNPMALYLKGHAHQPHNKIG
ncbi:hypothetical protein CR513_49858, partial [Mucuna pruriens]